MRKVFATTLFVLATTLTKMSSAVRVTEFDITRGLAELEMVPGVDGKFHLINISERQMEYAKTRRTDYAVKFYVLTRLNPYLKVQLFAGDMDSLKNSNLNPAHPTRVLIHGWLGSKTASINKEISRAYLERGDYNIIIVDWSDAALTIDYYAARRSIIQVGRKLAELLEFLYQRGDIDPRTTYLIGHSLGAHVSGVAARSLESGRIGVIVALDAASHLFTDQHSDRLTNADASYVLSIHTNGKGLGTLNPIGHASFYPNYGRKQPGCGADLFGGCSHSRCIEYFAESIKYEQSKFMSLKCSGFSEIANQTCGNSAETVYLGGDPINTNFRGVYYVRTNAKQPFALGFS